MDISPVEPLPLSNDGLALLLVVAICVVALLTFGVCYAACHSTAPELFRSFPGSAEAAPASP